MDAVGEDGIIAERRRLRLRTRGNRETMDVHPMAQAKRSEPKNGQELITLAQRLARDAERHALLSASLASQADRLMHAGLRLIETHAGGPYPPAGPAGKRLNA